MEHKLERPDGIELTVAITRESGERCNGAN